MSRIKSIIDSLNDNNSLGPELVEGSSPLIRGVDISQVKIPESADEVSETGQQVRNANKKYLDKKSKHRKSQSMLKENTKGEIASKDAI